MRYFSFLAAVVLAVGATVASAQETVLDKMLASKAQSEQLAAQTGQGNAQIYIEGDVTAAFQVVAGNCLDVTLRGQSDGMDESVFTKCMEEHFRGRNIGLTTDEFVSVVDALGDYLLKVTVQTNADYNSGLPFFHDMVKSITESVLASAKQVKSTNMSASAVATEPVSVGDPLVAVVDGPDYVPAAEYQPAAPATVAAPAEAGEGITGLIIVLLVIVALFAFAFFVWYYRNSRGYTISTS